MPTHINSLIKMSRRQFCALGAVATAVGPWCAASLAEDIAKPVAPAQPFRLKYVVSAAMYGSAPLDIVLSEVQKTGADTLDVWSKPHGTHREQIDQLGLGQAEELFKKHGVQLGVSTRYDLAAGKLSEEIAALNRLGGKLLVTGAKRQKGVDAKAQVANCVESLKADVDLAAKHGITIGIENHAGLVLDTPEAIRSFADKCSDIPNLGVALAPYHLPQEPAVIAALITDLGDKLVFFQAWEYGKGCMTKLPKDEEMMQLPGRGSLEFEPILGALKKINYDGFTEIFMHPTPRGVAIRETSEEVTAEINQSRKYLESRLAKVA